MQDLQQVRLKTVIRLSYAETILSRMLTVAVLCSFPQQNHRAVDEKSLPSLHTECEDIQSIIHRIKSSEIAHLWRNKHLEKVGSNFTGDTYSIEKTPYIAFGLFTIGLLLC